MTDIVKRINRLDSSVSNKIAAGEVVERPAAVVKELIENAIDAGSTHILVDIESGGKALIRITDNGCGITPEDLPLAFERHATSKVHEIEDLYKLVSLGFRGEALASIAAVSLITLTTKRLQDDSGWRVHLSGGKMVDSHETACQNGTSITVKDLFFNTPARLKFLRSTPAETAVISDLVTRLAISHPDISFKYYVDKKQIFMTPGDGDRYKALFSVFEKELTKNLSAFSSEDPSLKVSGYLSRLSYVRSNRSHQIFFVNGRYVKSKTLSDAVANAYTGLLPIGKFPVAILYIELPPELVDVNIHPAKTEIKFDNEYKIRDAIASILRKTLHRELEAPVIVPVSTSPVPASASIPVSTPVSAVASVVDSTPVLAHSSTQVQPSNDLKQKTTPSFEEDKAKSYLNERPTDYKAVSEPQMVNPIPEKFNRAIFEHIKIDALETLKESSSEQLTATPEPVIVTQETFLPPVAESLYDELRFIGQAFQSFLIFEKYGKLYWIDQHAAHEKILYEHLKKDFENKSVIRQILVKPVIVEVDHADLMRLTEALDDFERVGFIVEPFGTDSFVIREVPIAFSIPKATEFFEEILSQISQKKLFAQDIWLEKIIKSACKGAIKANDKLEPFEIKKLLEQLKTLESPYTCPHGRPIIVAMTRYEIEKMFKRT